MEQNLNDKVDFKNKFIKLYKKNKFKVYVLILSLIIISILIFFFNLNLKKKNNLIAENYIKAGIMLASGNKTESVNIYEKIILSKNKFYSLLALNTILEKNLISDTQKILNYFFLVEEKIKSKEHKDLLLFKKALFLIKSESYQEGEKLLNILIENKSQLKFLAEEIVKK